MNDMDVSYKAMQMKSGWIGDKPVPKRVYFGRMLKSYYDLGFGAEYNIVSRFAHALHAAYQSACTRGPEWRWWVGLR